MTDAVNVLGMGDPKSLFANQDVSNLVDGYVREALEAVQKLPADDLLATPTEDIIDFLVEKHSFMPPVLKREDAYIDGPHEIEVRQMDFNHEIRVRGTLLALVIPIEGEPGLLYMNPNRYGHSIRGNLYYNNLVLTVRGQNLQTEHVNKILESQVKEVEEMLIRQRGMAEQHRATLPQRLRPQIEERKRKLLADRQMVAGLAFPIRARANAPQTYVAPVVRRQLRITHPAKTAPFVPEPVLEEATYKSILDIIQSMTLVMERSPTAFSTMAEEDLRQHYLVQLNGQFEGAATGETFNYKGKTDILIREKDGNVFIAECKFWTGEKGFSQTIDQILKYVTWRDTKTAVIVFNRNKNFSEVVEKIKTGAAAHPQYKSGPIAQNETRLRYLFRNPGDTKREIILTAMAFDIPKADL